MADSWPPVADATASSTSADHVPPHRHVHQPGQRPDDHQRANGRYQKDLHVTDNGDGTLTILVLATGNYTLYGEDGRAIARNPGQVRFELLIDHGGTPDDPSDDLELDFKIVKESTGRSDDACEAAVPALS